MANILVVDDELDMLMLLRMKGETAAEIAGLAAAARCAMPKLPPVDLDWPRACCSDGTAEVKQPSCE